MKIIKVSAAVLGFAISCVMPLGFCDAPSTHSGEMLKVLNDLKGKGFIIIKKIEFNSLNGAFEATVVNQEGKNLSLQINPQSGEITRPASEAIGLTALEIAKKLNSAGYSNIVEINTDIFENGYSAKVIDNAGHKLKLNINAKTGEILKSLEL